MPRGDARGDAAGLLAAGGLQRARGVDAGLLGRRDGIGMPQAQLDKIFDMYGRLQQDIEGQGIGLYLAKKIVNATGGKIIVESEPGKGSKFMIHLIKTEPENRK